MQQICNPSILNITSRAEWRNWLQLNFNSQTEVWLVYAKKSTGEARILYNDAVEEALCFGWIDSINKPLGKDHTMQRFTPRKAGSNYSQPNIERLRWLAENHLIHPAFVKTAQEVISREFVGGSPPSVAFAWGEKIPIASPISQWVWKTGPSSVDTDTMVVFVPGTLVAACSCTV